MLKLYRFSCSQKIWLKWDPPVIQTQRKQHETLVNVISVLNVTRYIAQVNSQKLIEVMNALQRSNEDLDRLFSITESQQMYIYMCTILAYLRDSLTYMRQVAIHTMDYVDAAITNVLSLDKFPVEDQRNMLRHIESELLSMMHLPISSDNTLCFYQYLKTHVLIVDGQFLLLINMPIQNTGQELQIYEVFSLPVPHSNLPAEYKVNHKYIGVTYDEAKAVAITNQQDRACQHASGQFCRINALFQPLANL